LQVFQACYTAFQDVVAGQLQELIKIYTTLIFTFIFWTTNTLTKETFSLARIAGIAIAVAVGAYFFIKKYNHTLKKGKFSPSKALFKTQIKYAFWVFLGANAGTLF
jgi:O-antigen/teichoic acid export membrane protein